MRAVAVRLASGEQAEQSAITINLGGFARGRKARSQWRIAFVDSPLPQRWLQGNYCDFKHALVGLLGHPIVNIPAQKSGPTATWPGATGLSGLWRLAESRLHAS